MKTKIITVTATLVALSGCALGTPPMDIKPDQVDASLYANLSCDQMQDQYQQLLQDKEKYAARQKNRNARSRSMAIWEIGRASCRERGNSESVMTEIHRRKRK